MKAMKWEQGLFSAKYLSSGSSCRQPKPCQGSGRGICSPREPRPLLHTLGAEEVFCKPSAPGCAELKPSRAVLRLCRTSHSCWKSRAFMVSLCPLLKGPSLAVLSLLQPLLWTSSSEQSCLTARRSSFPEHVVISKRAAYRHQF